MSQDKEKPSDQMIYCSQCKDLVNLTEIVAHWQEKHGYKIYGLGNHQQS